MSLSKQNLKALQSIIFTFVLVLISVMFYTSWTSAQWPFGGVSGFVLWFLAFFVPLTIAWFIMPLFKQNMKALRGIVFAFVLVLVSAALGLEDWTGFLSLFGTVIWFALWFLAFIAVLATVWFMRPAWLTLVWWPIFVIITMLIGQKIAQYVAGRADEVWWGVFYAWYCLSVQCMGIIVILTIRFLKVRRKKV